MLQLVYFFITVLGCVALDKIGVSLDSHHKFVGLSDCRIHDVFVLKLHCMAQPFVPRFFDMAVVHSVILW